MCKGIMVFTMVFLAVCSCKGAYIIGWGTDEEGEISEIPSGDDFVSVTGGASYGLALRENGSLAAWGNDYPELMNVPAGNHYKAISAGLIHAVALRKDGSIVAWGNNDVGQCDVPEGNNYIAVSAGDMFNLALKADGSILGWGDDQYDTGILTDIPQGNDFIGIEAGMGGIGVAIKNDGTLVVWGGVEIAPSGNDYVKAASAGGGSVVALHSNGIVYHKMFIPSFPYGNNFIDITAGTLHYLALRSDGTVDAWGSLNSSGELNVPDRNDFVGIGAGLNVSFGLVTTPEPASMLLLMLGGWAISRRKRKYYSKTNA